MRGDAPAAVPSAWGLGTGVVSGRGGMRRRAGGRERVPPGDRGASGEAIPELLWLLVLLLLSLLPVLPRRPPEKAASLTEGGLVQRGCARPHGRSLRARRGQPPPQRHGEGK